MIRILVYPHIKKLKNPEEDNFFCFFRKLILSLKLADFDVFWYLVIPKFTKDKFSITKKIKKMFRLKNIKQISLMANNNYHIDTGINFSEMKKISWRDYSIDIVITNLPEQNVYLRKYFYQFTNISPVFISFYNRNDFLASPDDSDAEIISLTSLLMIDRCYVNSLYEKDALIEKSVKRFNVNTVRKINEKLKIFSYPSLPIEPEYSTKFDSSPLRIIVFNHKPESERSFPLFCASIEELWMKRKDFRVWVPNYQKRRVPFEWMITDIPNDTVQDYHYGLKRCYIGVAPRQTQANWAITTLDGLLCGLPYILYDSDYYKNLNPDADRYKNRRQLNKHLEFYLDNIDYRNNKAKEALSYAHDNFLFSSVVGEISKDLVMFYDNQRKIISSKAREISELVKKERRISQREILKREGWDAKTKFNPYRGYLLSDKNITEDKDNWKSVYIKK